MGRQVSAVGLAVGQGQRAQRWRARTISFFFTLTRASASNFFLRAAHLLASCSIFLAFSLNCVACGGKAGQGREG